MWSDDLRCLWLIVRKDLQAYYFKPPNISWGILFPLAFGLTFFLRDRQNLAGLAPGLLALTLLFSATSMEAIVITFERRIGALERLLLAPMRLPALLAGKILGGVVFALATTVLVLAGVLFLPGLLPQGLRVYPLLLCLALLLSAAAFSALGALVSVAVKEVFEAQTLANLFRFPMMFLGGVFVPVDSLPPVLHGFSYALPLTYAVRAMECALGGGWAAALPSLAALIAFTVAFFLLAVRTLARRLD